MRVQTNVHCACHACSESPFRCGDRRPFGRRSGPALRYLTHLVSPAIGQPTAIGLQPAASSMTIRLPVEILTAIFKELNNIQDLCNVRLACHALCATATPIAFRTLSVITTRASAQNLGRLFDLPDIAAHVREVSYYDTGADRKGRALNYGASSPRYPINDNMNCLYAPAVAGDFS